MLRVELFDMETHYPLAVEFWEARGYGVIPKPFIPRLGWVVYSDDVPAVMAWAVMSNSHGVAYLEWMVTNPDSRATIAGFKALLDAASETLLSLNYSVLFASTVDARAVTAALRFGFTVVEEHVTHLAKQL